MKKYLSIILFGICTLFISTMFGCTHTAELYPVQGPLSAQTPSPVLFAKIKGLVYPGDISVVLGDGEVLKGRWDQVAPIQVPKGATPANVPTTADMSSVWDTVYGTGFYVSHVLGDSVYFQAVASGNRGTVLNLEMYYGGEGVSAKGVGRDNRGNIFKLVLPLQVRAHR